MEKGGDFVKGAVEYILLPFYYPHVKTPMLKPPVKLEGRLRRPGGPKAPLLDNKWEMSGILGYEFMVGKGLWNLFYGH